MNLELFMLELISLKKRKHYCLKVLKISQTELSLKTNSVQKSGGSYEDVQAHSIRCLVDAAVCMLP